MVFFLIPLVVILGIGLLCLNFKIGFLVADWTRNTGFDMGFYMMAVVGLIAIEGSIIAYVINLLEDST